MSICPDAFVDAVSDAGIKLVTGVPDSLLKAFCSTVASRYPSDQHVSAPNEGAAIGLAIGHYLASRSPALVYLQNSGLGNAINPLASLACPSIYGIPMVLLIGWRGEIDAQGQQLADEPQHQLQGAITLQQLTLLGLNYRVLDAHCDAEKQLQWAVQTAQSQGQPVALVVRKGAFANARASESAQPVASVRMGREQALEVVLRHAPANSPLVVTTGMAAREVHEIRQRWGQPIGSDFLVVGGMGHALMIATAMAREMPQRKVLCIDGDGALLMHTGGLALSARQDNLVHIVINNEAHDSVGGQATCFSGHALSPIAQAFGYQNVTRVETADQIAQEITKGNTAKEATFIEVLCQCGHRPDLGRPQATPAENRDAFMSFLDT